jgi:hypothetical protein
MAGANRHDMKLVKQTVNSRVVKRPRPSKKRPQGMCLDKGYDYAEVRDTLKEFGFTAHIRARGEEAQAMKRHAGVKAGRWVVERTHKLVESLSARLHSLGQVTDNYLAFLHFACALIAFRASGLFDRLLSHHSVPVPEPVSTTKQC